MRPIFQVHQLNELGMARAKEIAEYFDAFLDSIELISGVDGREAAIVRSNLEVACFYAKKSMASRVENQAAPDWPVVEP